MFLRFWYVFVCFPIFSPLLMASKAGGSKTVVKARTCQNETTRLENVVFQATQRGNQPLQNHNELKDEISTASQRESESTVDKISKHSSQNMYIRSLVGASRSLVTKLRLLLAKSRSLAVDLLCGRLWLICFAVACGCVSAFDVNAQKGLTKANFACIN